MRWRLLIALVVGRRVHEQGLIFLTYLAQWLATSPGTPLAYQSAMGNAARNSLIGGLTLSAFACSAGPDADTGSEASGATSGERTVTLVYLGSSQFLRSCAGETLGCGRKVASVKDTTPYFSAPRSAAACDAFWTFRVNDRCVEAQHLEISDTHGFIEGNPGLFDALGLTHSDGVNCSGSGTKPGVTMERGRTCGTSAPPCTDAQCRGEPDVDARPGDCVDRTGWYCAVDPKKAIHCNGTATTHDESRFCPLGREACKSTGSLPTDSQGIPICQ
jgi:hypothetical protein